MQVFLRILNQKNQAMFQSKNLFEYLLVAHPSPELFALIEQEKRWFTEKYNQAIAAKTLPHITITNFLAIEEMELTINRWLQNICSLMTSFPVTLDGYGGFPPHTIYLRVKNHLSFQQLAKQLKPVDDITHNSGCPPFRIVNRPHPQHWPPFTRGCVQRSHGCV